MLGTNAGEDFGVATFFSGLAVAFDAYALAKREREGAQRESGLLELEQKRSSWCTQEL